MRYTQGKTFSGETAIVIDVSGLKIKLDDKVIPYLTFMSKNFTKLEKSSDEDMSSNIVIQPVNRVLEIFSREEKIKIVEALLRMHMHIISYVSNPQAGGDISQFIKKLGEMLVQLDQEISLATKLHQYVLDGHIRLDETEKAGSRSQDIKEMTFFAHDMYKLVACILISKMMTPVLASLMAHIVNLESVTIEVKETYTANLLIPLFQSRFPDTMEKLMYFIEHTVNKKLFANKSSPTSMIMHGTTEESTAQNLFGTVIVRTFVNIDLGSVPNNPMKFINQAIRKHIEHAGSNKTTTIQVRDPDKWKDEEGDNTGIIEMDSAVSEKPFIVPVLARAIVDIVVQRFLTSHNIDKSIHDQNVRYYLRHPFEPSTLATMLTCGVFGRDMGGAGSIMLLKYPQYVKLVTIVQWLAISKGYYDLGHVLTANVSAVLKPVSGIFESQLRSNYNNSIQYNSVTERFSIASSKIWNEQMAKIIDDIIQRARTYNTAPSIVIQDRPFTNGTTLEIPSTMSNQICSFILSFVGANSIG